MAGTSPRVRVAILEDHPIVIDGYLSRLGQTPQIEIVGTASSGVELEPMLAAHPADVALLDVGVPVVPGSPNPYPILHVIPRLSKIYPDLSILVISMLTERALISAVMEAGARGYLLKDDGAAMRNLGAIVLAVAGGEIYLSDQAQQQILARQPNGKAVVLTPRQQEMLSLCAAYPDWSLQDVATTLNVDYSTVRNTLAHAYLRLGARSLAAAIARARQLGLITPLPPVTLP
ncbi:MAG: response regulator transcription factor [Chloroflexi bacterium]|nr:response regulator transcription factor [Chloroflexota bacterium]